MVFLWFSYGFPMVKSPVAPPGGNQLLHSHANSVARGARYLGSCAVFRALLGPFEKSEWKNSLYEIYPYHSISNVCIYIYIKCICIYMCVYI